MGLTSVRKGNQETFFRDGEKIAKWEHGSGGVVGMEGEKINGVVETIFMGEDGFRKSAKNLYADNEIQEGLSLVCFDNGIIQREITFASGTANGPVKVYYPSGALRF